MSDKGALDEKRIKPWIFSFASVNVFLINCSTLSTSDFAFVSTLFMTIYRGFVRCFLIKSIDERLTVPAFTSKTQNKASHSLITSMVLSASSLSLELNPGVSRILILSRLGFLYVMTKYCISAETPSTWSRTSLVTFLKVPSDMLLSSLLGVTNW